MWYSDLSRLNRRSVDPCRSSGSSISLTRPLCYIVGFNGMAVKWLRPYLIIDSHNTQSWEVYFPLLMEGILSLVSGRELSSKKIFCVCVGGLYPDIFTICFLLAVYLRTIKGQMSVLSCIPVPKTASLPILWPAVCYMVCLMWLSLYVYLSLGSFSTKHILLTKLIHKIAFMVTITFQRYLSELVAMSVLTPKKVVLTDVFPCFYCYHTSLQLYT